jgi:hypothetical protein
MRVSFLNSITFILLLTFSVSLFAAKDTHKKRYSLLDNISIDIEDDTIILTSRKDDNEYVEITSSYELYVNGVKIDLTRSERRLVAKYYNQFFDIIEFAKEIGYDGAKLGVIGAKIGLKAAGKALEAVFSDYDIDDIEEDLEIESEQLESLVEELEERAEELEEQADEFEELHYELRNEIEELHSLRWF